MVEHTKEWAITLASKLWLHYNDDILGNRLIEAERFKKKAEKIMLDYNLTMLDIFPKKKRIILQFETHIIRRIKNIMSIMEIAESREFITIHDVSLLRGDCYTLVIEFSGKVTNVDFILEQFQTKKLI